MPRLSDLNIKVGALLPGPLNAITDVQDVRVGQVTVWEGPDIRTGVTAVLPHGGNLFQDKTPAGLAIGNGYGKLSGASQVMELGEIETPILLTNTLAVPRAAQAIIEWTLAQPGNEGVISLNPVAAETNDGFLNNIRKLPVSVEHCRQAIETAQGGPVAEGAVGAGAGTIAFGWKGGIGTSSRRLGEAEDGYTVGVLVQSNFGGDRSGLLNLLGKIQPPAQAKDQQDKGSIILLAATDAPLSDRNLRRLAFRTLAGLARSGANFSNGSGDFALAFSTHPGVRRTPERRARLFEAPELPNDRLSPLFLAAIEAAEEAIYNSLLQAVTVEGYRGKVEALYSSTS